MVVAVTVLTSFDEATLRSLGIERPLATHVEALAMMAKAAGLDGVVASPLEASAIRARCGGDFVIVTPGIRTGPSPPSDDQARTLSARQALDAGANYLVVGRPILGAPDPAKAAQQIDAELRGV